MVTPTRYEQPHREPLPYTRDQAVPAQPGLGAFWAVLVRNRLLIALCAVAVTAAAAYYTEQQTPTYEASASLRIWTREPNLPEIYRSASSLSNDMATEIAVLSSRALKEDAAIALGLPLRIIEPEGVARDELMTGVKVAVDAPDAEYVLMRRPDGRFGVVMPDSLQPIAISAPDGSVRLPGASFVLTPAAANRSQIRIGVTSTGSAVGRLSSLSVGQLSRDASIISLGYQDEDPVMAARVPNMIAARYMVRRQALEKGEAGSAARFLRDQLQRVSSDLRTAEDDFRRFKERERVLDPSVETGSEVSRLAAKEAERSNLEEERQALRASLAEIENSARSGEPSPYRNLVGLPFLLRNGAASSLLNALVSAENDRAALVKSTAQDPDVQTLTAKIRNIEGQLRTITQTYLQGLDNQAASLDASLGTYSQRLGAIPRKQLEFARRERQVKNLESVYNLLETRLNEAEIVEAVEDVSVAVVDSAVVPSYPSSPNAGMNLAAGLAAGLMLGVALACVRDVRDRSVHSRRDVLVATGIPVLGLIPRIPRGKGRVALITGHGRLKSGGRTRSGSNGRSREPASYTFLGGEVATEADSRPAPVSAPPAVVAADQGLIVAQWTNALAEAYSLLLTNIMFARPEPIKVIVITSPLAEDGKTTCAVNLAITLALRGARVLLVDGDLRRGVVHRALGTDQHAGLSEVLAGSAAPEEVVRAIPVGAHGGRLHFVTTGRMPPNPSALLESTQYQEFIGHARAEFDTVIVDAPPVNIISDASILGLSGDAVVMVARSGVTESASLTYAVEQLTRIGVHLVGVVLNDIDFKRDAVYDPAYRALNEYAASPGESR